MLDNVLSKIKDAWSVFSTDHSSKNEYYGSFTQDRPDRTRLHVSTERSIIASIYNRIAIDVAAVDMKHVRVDQNGRFQDEMDSPLNRCLSTSANLDQTGRNLRQDIALSLCDEGCVAVVPVDISRNYEKGSYDIYSLRVGKILEWFPSDIRVELYNEKTAQHEQLILPKEICGIIENPLYSVMNQPNSTLQRLIHKLNLLDAIDEQSSSGKLDLIIQVPHPVRTDLQKKNAEDRRVKIEEQLKNSKYGIAYIDGTEHVVQLNRPAENNLMEQIEYLTTLLYGQLGLTEAVFNGSADEKEMLNYYTRTIEPFLAAISDELTRKFLTRTAQTQGQRIMFFRDPFKLAPVADLADIADRFTRNEILSSNDFRAIIGYKPDKDPRADELRNKNLRSSNDQLPTAVTKNSPQVMQQKVKGENQNER